MSIDPNNLAGTAHITFDDDFNNLSLWNGSSGTWATIWPYQDISSNGSSLPSNGEEEWYINSSYGPTAGYTPWTTNNGVLTITATPTPSWLSGQVNNYAYTSGEINTAHSFAQTYGYFEMRAELPAGQGFWPAFWLMPTDGAWPPELDVVETLGANPSGLITTLHSNDSGTQNTWTQIPDSSAGYHTYGVDWEPDYITWYFDGQQVYQLPTPADMNSPMYMIANLAVGGYWQGAADGTSSAQLNIDYIRAYASGGDGSSPPPSGGSSSSGSSGSTSGGASSGDTGSSGSSSGDSGSGGDVISGAWATTPDAWFAAPSDVTNVVLSGWNQTVQANDQGDTIYSTDAQNVLLGGAGNDIFYMGRGGDSASSGGGTDTFVFSQVPWASGHISGFGGADVLDLAFLQAYGYGGSDPIADGRVQLVSDGAGGTQVWADLDGLSGVSGTWLVTTLDGINPSNLTWQNGHLVDPPGGGSSSGGGSSAPPSGGSGGTPSNGGQVFTSDNNGDWVQGTSGNDVFNLGRGGDHVTGGGGADVFKFAGVPWNAGGHITDFGADDQLDLSGMFSSVGYWNNNSFGDGHLWLTSDGVGGTQIWFDMEGLSTGSGTWLVTTLDGVDPSSLSISNGVITEGGSSGGSSGGSGSTGSSGGSGQTFTSDNNGDWVTGTAGDDTFNLGRGGDHVTGGGGNDTFKFAEVPWSPTEIYDFHSGDTIDLSGMFQRYGYSSSDPVGDGHLKIVSDGSDGSQIWFDMDGLAGGSGSGNWQLLELDHFNPSNLHVNGAFITG
ncbi:MAG TPA: glycoside hydrolase family 16 protein [Caulobacteraceae bacterium]